MRANDPFAPYARLAVVGLIREAGAGRWLLTIAPRSVGQPGLWAPPGGRLEPGESLVEATLREVREEVGLEVRVAGPCYAYVTMHKGERTAAVTMACSVESVTSGLELAPAEAEDARWVTLEEWLEMAARDIALWTASDIRLAVAAAEAVLGATQA